MILANRPRINRLVRPIQNPLFNSPRRFTGTNRKSSTWAYGRQRCQESGICLRSYLNCMNGSPHFIVDVYTELLGDLQRYGKRVRDLVLQGSGTGPATHLNFQVPASTNTPAFSPSRISCCKVPR